MHGIQNQDAAVRRQKPVREVQEQDRGVRGVLPERHRRDERVPDVRVSHRGHVRRDHIADKRGQGVFCQPQPVQQSQFGDNMVHTDVHTKRQHMLVRTPFHGTLFRAVSEIPSDQRRHGRAQVGSRYREQISAGVTAVHRGGTRS